MDLPEDFECSEIHECPVCQHVYVVDAPLIEDGEIGEYGEFLIPAVCPRCDYITDTRAWNISPESLVEFIYAIYGASRMDDRYAISLLAPYVRRVEDIERCLVAVAGIDIEGLAAEVSRERPRRALLMLHERRTGVLAWRIRELGQLVLEERESECRLHLELLYRRAAPE